MPSVILPSLLSQRAGRSTRIDVEGPTARHVLRTLEQRHPALRGWILDEQGHVRQHVKLFINDHEATLDADVTEGDELHIVPAISGG